MIKEQFEQWTGSKVSEEDYKRIENAYMELPSVPNGEVFSETWKKNDPDALKKWVLELAEKVKVEKDVAEFYQKIHTQLAKKVLLGVATPEDGENGLTKKEVILTKLNASAPLTDDEINYISNNLMNV